MLLRRRRPPFCPLASPHCWAWSDGQDRPPLATTSPLHAHLVSPRAHVCILHASSPPYLPRLLRMTLSFLSPCTPIPQSNALFRPKPPNLRARYQDRVLCAPHLAVPSPSLLPPSTSVGDRPTARALLLARRLTLVAPRHCLRAHTPPAAASAFAQRPRSTTMPATAEDEAVAELAQQESCAE